jgi:hypothetical protein
MYVCMYANEKEVNQALNFVGETFCFFFEILFFVLGTLCSLTELSLSVYVSFMSFFFDKYFGSNAFISLINPHIMHIKSV